MLDSICQELSDQVTYLEGKTIETIYFGGGTPSLLTQVELAKILDTIHANYQIVSYPEITLESNPDDISLESLKMWNLAGVNRLSIGLQSFKPEDLEWMNRAHTVDEALNCIQLAKSIGFENITVDLIYGLPNLTMDEWQNHILTVLSMDVPHISAYCLTVEAKTALANMVKKGKIVPASEDIQSDQFLLLLNTLEQNDYQQYEISNFSKPGTESRHNGNYWKGEWYLGVGPSAHSFNGVSRRWNVSNNQIYMKSLEDEEPYSETEVLSPDNQFNERILIGLRTMRGVNIEELQQIQKLPDEFAEKISDFEKSDWLTVNGLTIALTKEGRLRADYIASELFV